MRSILFATILVFFTLFCVFGNDTATLHLRVVVPETVSISVENTEEATNLNFLDNPKDVLLGTVKETSNSLKGYEVFVSSKNAVNRGRDQGLFISSDVSETSVIQYWLTYGGEQVFFKEGVAKITSSTERVIGNEKEVRLEKLIHEHILEKGIYQDTLTFTIASK